MPDVQDLLQHDSVRWREELAPPPDLAAAARAAVAAGGATAPVRRRIMLSLSVAATVLLIVGVAAFFVDGGSSRIADAPASITIGGHRFPYAGPVPWADAVSDPNDPRLIYVWADGDHVDAGDICHVIAFRAVVAHRDGDSVSIAVAGYTPASERGSTCYGSARSPARVPVHLPAPLAGRTLVDAHDGAHHHVLDATTVPDFHDLPPQCGMSVLSWNEKTSVASRQFHPRTTILRCILTMEYGPSAAIDALEPPIGTAGASVRIHGALATVTRFNNVDNHSLELQWSPSPGTMIRLGVNSDPAHHLTDAHAVAIARAIR